jgi:hypothetical protein
MNKDLMAVGLFPVSVNGLISDPFESDREVEIETDNSKYFLADELEIRVDFKNHLSRDIRIVNSGSASPFFILEKKFEDSWEQVYSSDGIEFYVEPTNLENGQIFSAEIKIYTDNINSENPEGEYRLIFDLIEKENYNSLPDKYMYSNVFNIVR